MKRRSACLLVLLAATIVASTLHAHELGLVQVEAEFLRDGTYAVDFNVDREHLPEGVRPAAFLETLRRGAILSFDGQPALPTASAVSSSIEGRPSTTRLRLSGRTPSGVSRFTLANAAIPDFCVVRLRNEGEAGVVTQWVEGGKASAPFPLAQAVIPPSRSTVVRTYLALGFAHILPRGLDHVLFVLGIFLLGSGLRPMLWQVSAFTVAHTITLALTIYGAVSLPSTIVEPLIALSIVYVAVENVLTTKLHAWRPLIVFGFGLLHGMGFAGVLTEIGLPRSEFIPALLAFNAGVECGQLTVILAAFLLIGLPLGRRPWYRRFVVIPLSLTIAAIGLYWFVERVFPG